MKRRDFVGRVVLGGAAAACTNFGSPAHAAPASGAFKFRFIGLMGFVERKDRSFLVATPGQATSSCHAHPVPNGAHGLAVCEGVRHGPSVWRIPAAFDKELEGSRPADFVYRSLDNTSIEVLSGSTDRVVNEATQMAHLHSIAPGKRVRGNIEKWASSTISLRGGRDRKFLGSSGRRQVMVVRGHRQQLTDAVNYQESAVGDDDNSPDQRDRRADPDD